MKPIYKPSGRAGEYGDYALNIYTGCTHRCVYCFGPKVLHKDKETFHTDVRLRPGLLEALEKQLAGGEYAGKLIHLCFTCDPYPADIDTAPTREVIKMIKAAGGNVQILTKAGLRADRDFDLLDDGDWFGVTLTGYHETSVKTEPNAGPPDHRIAVLHAAKRAGINTWISCEPVYDTEFIYEVIEYLEFDKIKIGKLNYYPSDINWAEFGREAERLCIQHGRDYYIKDDLRAEMNK